jgi:hypothetical protein
VTASMILSFLNKVTCDHVQSALTAQSFAPPTPVSPAKRSPASPRSPTVHPVRPTTTTPSLAGCRTKTADETPSCVVAGSNKNGFACYNLAELLPPYCSAKQLHFVLNTCDGLSLRKTTRDLHGDSADGYKKASAVSVTVTNVALNNATSFVQEQTSSSTSNSFQASNCKKSCILSSNHLCFDAASNHVFTYIAINGSGHQVGRTYKTTIALKTNHNNNSCRTANVKCV